MSEKKNFKFNIIDAIILVVLLAAVCFAGWHLFGPGANVSDETVKYVICYTCDEVPEYAAQAIFENDLVSEEYTEANLGYVTGIKLSPSTTYTTDAQGEIHLTSKPHYNTVDLQTVLEMPKDEATFAHGVRVDEAKLGVGHSITIRVGKAKVFGRVSGIDIVK